MYQPTGVAFDSSGNLWIADHGNSRITRYSPPFSSGASANLVLGQSGFTSSTKATSQAGLNKPWGIAIGQTGSVWVADEVNNRTMRFSSPFSNGMSADLVLGQSGFTTGTSAGGPHTMQFPVAVAFDSSGNLWVGDYSNTRVLEYTPSFSTGMAASLYLGAWGLNGNTQNHMDVPRGLAIDSSGNLWVGDDSSDRVLLFSPAYSSGMNANLVLGEPDFASYTTTAAQSVVTSADGVALDPSGNLWVVDYYSNRILMFSPPFFSGMNANLVIGQSSFTTTASATGASSLNDPAGLTFDSSGNLWVADQLNNRVLMFAPPFSNGMSATLAIGQTTLSTGIASVTQNGLYYPFDVAVDSGGNLWVSDYYNNRILMFAPPFSTGMAASLVIGQPSFSSNSAGAGQSGLNRPEGIGFDPRGNLWVADHSNNRVLRFAPSFSSGMNANLVIGQSGFATTAAATSQSGFNSPKHLAFDSAGNLWVSDGKNNRVLQFLCGSECPPATLSFGFSVVGGGSGFGSPTLTYMSGGTPHTATLTGSPTSFSIDYGSKWTTGGTLAGSSASERWAVAQATGTATATQAVSLVYYHQYSVAASYAFVGASNPNAPSLTYTSFGAQSTLKLTTSAQSLWADAGSAYSAPNPLSGSTSSERWFASSTNGTIASSGTINLSFRHQYYLTVVGKSGASTWLDEGPFAFKTPAVYNRANGVGQRIASISVDGGSPQTQPLTAGNVSLAITMNGPHTLTLNAVNQYQVSLDAVANQALSSITPPTISGDIYWYDSGTQVTVTLNGVWNRASGTGSRIVSYSVNGGPQTSTATSAKVTALSLSSISSYQSVTANSIAQYQLSTPTGSVSSTTVPPISGDTGWYDAGASVTISYNSVWNVIAQQSRSAATGYAVDGGKVTAVTEGATTPFSVSLTMSSSHTIDVKSVTQFFASFHFTDASGSKAITPAALQITVAGQAQDVPGFATWLDASSTYSVSKVTYEGVDVKPQVQQYTATGPATINVKVLVYDASVKATDFLGFAVSGAQVKMTLANGTVLSGTTNGDGVYTASGIPLGTFTASVSGLGSSTQVSGDASKQSVTPASVLFGTVSLGLVVGIVVVAGGAAAFLLRRRSHRPAPAGAGTQVQVKPAQASCPNCGAPLGASLSFCENCGTKIS
ncbi:MAG: hypothetical protein LYZ66_06115 [Nitrososphaerales archaeon]|nr:hypothetical protein [Nitrososphaerales archaeon]